MQIQSLTVFALAACANGKPLVQSSAREAGSLDDMARNIPRRGPSWESGLNGAKALYFMTNRAENAIVAIPIGHDGFPDVAAKTMTATGGMGGNLASTTDGSKNGPDALSSQGSVQVVGDLEGDSASECPLADFCNLVLAVNPGSGSVSMLKISEHNPLELTLVGDPVSTGGDYPTTLAVANGLVCTGNTGAKAGVSCASFGPYGLGAFDALHPFDFQQTDPPTGPFNGIAQVLFSDDESELLVIVRGNLTATRPGGIATFPVAGQTLSYQETMVTPADSKVLFGTTTIPGTNNILASDAAFGALLLSLDDLAQPLAITNITDQMATCWAITSPVTGTGFVDDVVVSHLVEVDLSTGAIVSEVPCNNDGQGLIDMRAVGGKIYAMAPGNGTVDAAITVFDISGGRGTVKPVGNFPVPGVDKNAEGLAVLAW